MQPQVLVVGAGPVGLTLASELARYKIPLRIIDKAAQRTDKSKALVLWARTLELFDRAGYTGALVEAGNKADGATLAAGGKTIAQVSFESIATPHPYALMLPQSETERLLESHLSGLGVEVEREVELTTFTAADDSVAATLLHRDGSQETLQVPWLVGCDGAHSTIRHGLGKEFVGKTLPSQWILADVHFAGPPMPANRISIIFHPSGAVALFPMLQGRYRIIAQVDQQHVGQQTDVTLAQVQAIMDERVPGGIQVSNPVWLSGFAINERKVADYRGGRVFLAGDAAHIHSPAGGQGMNTGMQDVFNLAWKLALVCRGTCPAEPLLGSYDDERSAVGRAVLADTGRLTAIATVQNSALQSVRNSVASLLLGFAPARHAMANNLSELSIGYADSPLTRKASFGRSGAAPGERAPIRNGEAPVGGGDTPRFALFAQAGDECTWLIARFPDLLEASPRAPFDEHGMWLVRPDGYVAATVARDAHGEIADYLGNLAGAGRA